MGYQAKDIRNICLLGHGGTGKTSLTESILFTTGMTDRLGKVSEGNTVSDFDAEETRRQFSISDSTVYAEYNGKKINIIDTPGYYDFSGEVFQALRVAAAGVIVGSAKDGLGVGGEKAWDYLAERKMPRVFYISKVDEENGDYDKAFAVLREKYGNGVCPLITPIKDENGKVIGLVDILMRKAFIRDSSGKAKEAPIPESMADYLEPLYTAVNESVAETSDEFMEKYFSGEEFTFEERQKGLRQGMKDLTLFPVLSGDNLSGLGIKSILNAIDDLFPSPVDMDEEIGETGGEESIIVPDESGSTCALVYKTLSDQYGKFSFFKVLRGKVTNDMTLTNSRTGSQERIGHLFLMQGKKGTEVSEVGCGDIGAVSKLSDTRTSDALCDPKAVIAPMGIDFPAPCYSMAIFPKAKGQEDKIAAGLTRLAEEDLTFTVEHNAETHEMILSGAGDMHLDVLCAKLKSKFGVDVVLAPAKVPYREKIRKKVKVQGRHKKQSGGHGQFGNVWIEFEPGETEDLYFEQKIFGGSVPKNFHPSVEKGLRDCMGAGILAGYPVVFLKATLVDGSYHDVDSSEMAFKMAAAQAYKAGLPLANPVLLEPIGALEVTVPDDFMGDIIGDLNKRRGHVMGMNPTNNGNQIISAEVPMAEMTSYAVDLRSMTHGRGSFTFSFIRYDETPANIQQSIVNAAQAGH